MPWCINVRAALPPTLQLERLQTLKLTGSLFSIPDTVWGLTSLKLLDVSKCKLRQATAQRLLQLRVQRQSGTSAPALSQLL